MPTPVPTPVPARMPAPMLTPIFRAAATWTAIGLASGLYYREFTKLNGVPGGTQLAVAHTHLLALGTLFMLALLALVAVFPALSANRAFRSGFWAWQVGLGITTAGMLVKGSLQVLADGLATSPAIAGISGLGHITLTAAFLLLFMGLAPSVREAAAAQRPAASSEQQPTPAEPSVR